jgi:hypothetical protein
MPAIDPILLTTEEKNQFLLNRLPDRMFEIYIGRQMIDLRSDQKPGGVRVDGRAFSVSSGYLIANSFLDAGILMSRALLDFLGVYLKPIDPGVPIDPQASVAIRQRRPRQDDLMVVDFGGKTLALDDLKVDDAGNQSDELFNAVFHVLMLANKTIGHLTQKSARDEFDPPLASMGFDRVIALINRHVYTTLSLPTVEFDTIEQPRFSVISQ